jgi:PQQ-dependent dehydrogenase (methanol/ethanol family)
MNGLLFVIVIVILTSTFRTNAQTDDGQWQQPAKDFQNTRFSSLDEINTTNASKLKVAWTFSTGVDRGQEAAPIVASNLMFVVTPYPNIVYALDLTKPGSVKWKYEPKPSEAAQGVACCDVFNRGACYADGKIFFNTLDCYSVCLEAQSGKELWKTQLGDINKGETITMAPLVAKGKVFVGNSGGEFGVRGWVTALDENSGKIAWRAYSTGPDADCLISTNFHPFYPQNRGKDLGVSSWPPNFWQIGGGTVWGWVSYDPKSNLIFYGTANPGSWNPSVRPGDKLWTCGIFARDADTGDAKWFYQLNAHDLFDHDEINENILLDMPISGTNRPVLIHPGRNGYMYVMDRNTGEVLSATPYGRITAAKGVDLKSGRLIMNEEKKPQTGKVIRDIQPASPGAKDWQPCAYSPRTKLLYVPHQNLSMDYEGTEANYIEGTPYLGVNVKMYAGPGGYRGEFLAWNILEKKPAWSIKENFPVWSGTLVTGGDVTFYGTLDGWFKAINARTGEELWKFKTGSGIIGQPVTYRGPDGKQYVAILSGIGGWVGAVVSGSLDVRDPTAALGFVNAVSDLPNATTKGGTLYVFSL